MNRIRIGIAVAAVIAVAFLSTGLVGQDNSAREEKDRAEIEALMWRYTRALDTSDGTTYAATYTTDGQFKDRHDRRCITWKPIPGLSSSTRIMPATTRTT